MCVFQTRVDFTVCNGILIVLAVDLLMFGVFSTFYYSHVLQIVYGSLGALVYALVSHRSEGNQIYTNIYINREFYSVFDVRI